MNRNRKFMYIAGAIVVLILLVLWIVFAYQPPGTLAVRVVVLPYDSTLTVDDKPSSAGRLFLSLGTHTLKASRSDFTDVTKTIKTDDLKPNQVIYMMPLPNSEAAIKWLEAHPEVQELREKAGAEDAATRQQEISKKFPIIDELPYESLDFRIAYGLTSDNKLTLQITLYPYALKSNTTVYQQQLRDFKAEAKQWLSQNGVNLTDYEVTFDPAEASNL